MYETFYGLQERPFNLTPDPRFLLLTDKHREALSTLRYGICGQTGVTLLIGEAGTGKTTVIRKALDEFQAGGHQIAYLNNPALTRQEFLEWLTAELPLSKSAGTSKARVLRELTEELEERQGRGSLTALLIDEAQSLPDPLLEEIRLLANIESPTEKLLPVVLAGQPELAERLNQPSLRQLKQRVALRCTLSPLTAGETAAYIAGRIERAGGKSREVFSREAVETIIDRSGGIPRVISVICDNALIAGLAVGRRPVTQALIEEVCGVLDLQRRKRREVASGAVTLEVVEAAGGQAAGGQHAAAANNGRMTGLDGGRDGRAPAWRPATLFAQFTERRRFWFL